MSIQEETQQSVFSVNEGISKLDAEIPKSKQQDPYDFFIVTRIPQKAHKFQWIIRQFSKLSKNKALYSTAIHASADYRYQLKLVKYDHGFGLFHANEVQSNMASIAKSQHPSGSSLFGYTTIEPTEPRDENNFTLKFEYQVSAADNKGKELIKWSVCFPDYRDSLNVKIGEYINNNLETFPEDTLILNCNVIVNLIPITEEIKIASKPSLDCNSWNKLSANLKTLYQNSEDTDVTLVVGTEKIRAHKLILTARSPIFKKIFHHDMEEAEQNSVVITDVQLSALQRLVEFFYAGVILDGENKDMSLQELLDLYYAADKYEVVDLREMVGNTLVERFQMDDVSEALVWADRHNDTNLKFRLMNFIRINFEVVSNTVAWKSCVLHHPKLAMEVVDFCVTKAVNQ